MAVSHSYLDGTHLPSDRSQDSHREALALLRGKSFHLGTAIRSGRVAAACGAGEGGNNGGIFLTARSIVTLLRRHRSAAACTWQVVDLKDRNSNTECVRGVDIFGWKPRPKMADRQSNRPRPVDGPPSSANAKHGVIQDPSGLSAVL